MGRSVDDISLLEVIEAIDGPLATSLPVVEGFPVESRTKLERSLCGVTTGMRRELASIKLSALLPKRRDSKADGLSSSRLTRSSK